MKAPKPVEQVRRPAEEVWNVSQEEIAAMKEKMRIEREERLLKEKEEIRPKKPKVTELEAVLYQQELIDQGREGLFIRNWYHGIFIYVRCGITDTSWF